MKKDPHWELQKWQKDILQQKNVARENLSYVNIGIKGRSWVSKIDLALNCI